MNEAMQFIVVLGSAMVLIVGVLGIPLILGWLGAARLKAFDRRLAELEQRSEARLADLLREVLPQYAEQGLARLALLRG